MVPLLPNRLFPTIKSPGLAINFRFFLQMVRYLGFLADGSSIDGCWCNISLDAKFFLPSRRKKKEDRTAAYITGCVAIDRLCKAGAGMERSQRSSHPWL